MIAEVKLLLKLNFLEIRFFGSLQVSQKQRKNSKVLPISQGLVDQGKYGTLGMSIGDDFPEIGVSFLKKAIFALAKDVFL